MHRMGTENETLENKNYFIMFAFISQSYDVYAICKSDAFNKIY